MVGVEFARNLAGVVRRLLCGCREHPQEGSSRYFSEHTPRILYHVSFTKYLCFVVLRACYEHSPGATARRLAL